MKTGGTSGKKNFVFAFHSVCAVFVPFKMEYFQSPLIIRALHNYKGFPYEASFQVFVLIVVERIGSHLTQIAGYDTNGKVHLCQLIGDNGIFLSIDGDVALVVVTSSGTLND